MNHDRGSLAVDAPNATVPPVSYGYGFGLRLQMQQVARRVIATCRPTATSCRSPTSTAISPATASGIRIATDGLFRGLNVSSGTIAGVAPDTPEESCIGSAAGRARPPPHAATTPPAPTPRAALNYVRVKSHAGAMRRSAAPSCSPAVAWLTSRSAPRPRHPVHGVHRQPSLQRPGGLTGSIHPQAAGYRIPAVVVPTALATGITSNLNAIIRDSAF